MRRCLFLEAATFSAIAAIGSCCAAWFNYRLAKEKEEKSQATKIAAWITDINPNMRDEVVVTVANNSDLPIYDVFVIGYMNHQELVNINVYKPVMYRDLLPPNASGENRLYRMDNLGADIGGKHMVVAIFFRDANGKCWLRDHKGIFKDFHNYTNFLMTKGVYGPYSQYLAREYIYLPKMRRKCQELTEL